MKLSIKKAHIALRLDGSTITRCLTEYPPALRAVPSHTASHSTLLPGWQYITRFLTEHSALRAVPSHAASQSTLPGGQYHHTQPHGTLCCLEGSTMSNLVHRQRRCARIVLYTILCLEGSTPEDRYLSRFLSYGCSNTNPLNSFHPY